MLKTRYTKLDEALLDYSTWYISNQARVIDPVSCTEFLRLACNGRLFIMHLLRNAIVSLRQTYTNPTDVDKALDQYTAWYAANAETIVDAEPMLRFLKKATDDSLHVLHLLRDELRAAKGQTPQDSLLILPPQFRTL